MASGSIPFDGRRYGRETCTPGELARHRHAFGYICVIVSGRFLEAGDAGRFRVAAGDVLVHRPFEAHLDRFGGEPAQVLNLPLVAGLPDAGAVRVADLDRVAGLAERDPYEAAAAICEGWTEAQGETDWPDLLAAALRTGASFAIGDWARRHGLAAATVSRGFRQAYGTTPARFRAEARARRAWQAVRSTPRPLAQVACDAGFSDQPHMTRAITQMTGLPPKRWRASQSP
jgi:AraC-like DNA-binding protein